VFFIFVGLLIAVKPYLAVKVCPDNQNIWQDCYAITLGLYPLLEKFIINPLFKWGLV